MTRPPCVLDQQQALEVLFYLHKQRGYSVRRLAQLLDVSKSTIHRVLARQQAPPAKLRVKLCELLSDEELLQILRGRQLLEQYNLVDEDGRLNKALALALLDAMLQDELLREEVLSYILKYYKTEIIEKLSETLPKIQLRWSVGFEKWLTERKSKPISQRTLKDYKNYWYNCLEGKVLGWHLTKQLNAKQMLCADGEYHPTAWPRQVFRHYVNYLYSIGRLDWDTYTRLLLAVPGRRYGRKVLQKPILIDDVKRTLQVLREERQDIYTLYLFMLYSAARFEHSLKIFKEWKTDEVVYVSYLNRNVKRLECFEEFCRYYVGHENSQKPAGFAYFPTYLIHYINKYRSVLPGRRVIEKVVARLDVLRPKTIRIFAIREMKKVFDDTDTFKFITSKFGELTVSARHYLDLLSEADTIYSRYIKHIREVIGDENAAALTA